MKDNNADYDVISRLIVRAWDGRVSNWIMIEHSPQPSVTGQRDTRREEDARSYVFPSSIPMPVIS
jgi:hypothetical protein